MEAPYRAVLLSQQHMKVKWSNGAANSVSVGQYHSATDRPGFIRLFRSAPINGASRRKQN